MTPTSRPVRVAICEDSYAYGRGLRRLLEADGTIEVVGVATSANELLERLPHWRADLVTMDIELPGTLGGEEAIARIVAERPLPIVVLSAHAGTASRVTQALAAGALEAFSKATLRLDDAVAGAAFRARIVALARSEHGAAGPAPPPAPAASDPAGATGSAAPSPGPARLPRPTVIGLVASAGGPRALATVLAPLPATFPIPILLVQHMSPGFTAGLATWLDDTVAIPVALAVAGAPLPPGVHVAPEDRHLLVAPDGRLTLATEPAHTRHRPSADALLASLARVAGPRALAIVLTGMGRDGAVGVRAVRAAGGRALAESRESAAVWGMPAAALAEGATPLTLEELGRALAELSP